MERHENTAEYSHGVLFSNYPALANDTGEINNKTAYDVILIANPGIAKAERRIINQSGRETLVQYPELNPPDMILIPWSETAGTGSSMSLSFYDSNGNHIFATADE